jgi:excinuclease ABC subunit C
VLIPVDVEDREVREAYLSELRGKRVEIFRPQRGDRVRLIEMATENARQSFATRRSSEEQQSRMADELRRRLVLRGIPRRIECFDISNIQGRAVVGSKVSFEDGQPDKSRYRRYRVKSVAGQDDFASLYEVLHRRLSRGLEEKDLPDLLVIDGGKGQLAVARTALDELGIHDLDVVGLAKDRVERDAHGTEIQHSEERVFLPGRKNPVVLPRNSNALFLLQRVRDEAHRFAITYHRELRGRERLRSTLDDIPGVGLERRRRLLREFGSVRRLAAASAEEIATVPGIGLELARAIVRALRAREEKRQLTARGRLTLKPIGSEETSG